MKHIYLVEDEQTLCVLLEKYLAHEGYEVTTFLDGISAMEHIHEKPHLWILDINLPGYNGYTLIKAIKANYPDLPVIFISARNEELDRVVGLELGSDDYLPKPFLPRELVLRTNRLLERIYNEDKQKNPILTIGDYELHLTARTLSCKGEIIPLTGKEFDLLCYFIAHKNQVLSREQLLSGVWGADYFGSDRTVDDTIRRLRKKLVNEAIETIYGLGYKWTLTL